MQLHGHCLHALRYEYVFVTKQRRECLSKTMLARAKEICTNIAESFGMELYQFSGDRRHIRLVVDAKPGAKLSRLANSIKTVTARLLRKEFGERLTRKLEAGLWEESYVLRTKSLGRVGTEEYLGKKRIK